MMNAEDKEAVFVDAAKAGLDEAVRALDPVIASRLRLARQSALEASQKKRLTWIMPATGFAAAFVGILAFFLLLQSPEQPTLVSENALQNLSGGVEDLELLASSETIEFYDDLEFYGWLAEENRAG